MQRAYVCVVFLASAAFLGPSAFARQAVRFDPRPEAGRQLRYAMTAEYSLRTGIAAEAAGTVLKQSAVLRFTASPEHAAGSSAVRAAVERLRVELTRFDGAGTTPRTAVFEWNGTDEPTVSEDAPAVFRAYPVLVKSVADLRLHADGTIESFTGYDPVYAAAGAARSDGPRASFLGAFSQAGAWSLFESIYSVDPGEPPAERRVGDEWSRVEAIQLSPAREARTTTRLTFKSSEGALCRLEGGVRTEVQPPKGEPDPADPGVRVAEQRGSVALTWDASAGRLVERTAERFIVWEATLDLARPVVVKDYTSSRITIRLVEDPPGR
jgi:hypothetical protein